MKIIILFTMFLLGLTACTSIQTETLQPSLPNPASVYCVENGGTLEIRTAADGSQAGVCVFSDGSECDEWAYFKGECGASGQTSTLPVVTDETPSESSEVIGLESQPGVTVTYVGNSGFLITTSHKKILIDAVFRGIEYVYTLPEDIQNSLALAQPPFDDVDLILVSHSHRDHFDSSLVKQLLQNSPSTTFASQSRIASQYSTMANPIVFLDPEPGKPVTMDMDGVVVKAMALPHGAEQPGNIGFLITVDDVKLFYSGDVDFSQVSYDEFRGYSLPEEKIDIALVTHYYFTNNPEEQRILKEGIGARFLIPTHYYFTDPPFDRATILSNYPDAVLFNKALSSWEMPK